MTENVQTQNRRLTLPQTIQVIDWLRSNAASIAELKIDEIAIQVRNGLQIDPSPYTLRGMMSELGLAYSGSKPQDDVAAKLKALAQLVVALCAATGLQVPDEIRGDINSLLGRKSESTAGKPDGGDE